MSLFTWKNIKLVGLAISIVKDVVNMFSSKSPAATESVQSEPEQAEMFEQIEEPIVTKPARAFNGRKADCNRDRTPFTQHHYDVVMKAHNARISHNTRFAQGEEQERISVKNITEFLNEELNLKKSRQSYAEIWCNKVSRETLPTGNQELKV